MLIPNIKVTKFVFDTDDSKEVLSSMALVPPASTPKKCLTWLRPIIMAEAVMKALITGCDKKLAIKPSRKNPNKTRTTPDVKARVTAAAMYSVSLPKDSLSIATAVINDSIATGATDNVLLEPNKA